MHLYKYRGGDEVIFKRDLNSLVENFYWGAAIHTLNDPCEALINTSGYFGELEVFEKTIQSLINKNIEHISAIIPKSNQHICRVIHV